MACHNILGTQGEEIAKKYLIQLGYNILNTKRRTRHLELGQ